MYDAIPTPMPRSVRIKHYFLILSMPYCPPYPNEFTMSPVIKTKEGSINPAMIAKAKPIIISHLSFKSANVISNFL